MKLLIVANWKMNPQTLGEARRNFDLIKKAAKKIKGVEVIVCPPFVFLPVLTPKGNVKLGGQDCFWVKEKGAFTGEISPLMLKNLGCQYVILGHSERRIYFGETDEMINKKIKAALEIKLNPILCIGETAEEKEEGKTLGVLRNQLREGLKSISSLELRSPNFNIAYEPVWAIGTGNPCEIDEAMSAVISIRKILAKLYSRSISQGIRILYGGSVDVKNAAGYIKEARMDGLLVGGVSLDPKEFLKIIEFVC